MSDARQAILDMLATAHGKSIDPMNVAKSLQAERWQRLLPLVRREAIALAKAGEIVILRNNKPADPDAFRGVYRLSLPRSENDAIVE